MGKSEVLLSMPISLFIANGKTRMTQNSTLLLLPVPDNSASHSCVIVSKFLWCPVFIQSIFKWVYRVTTEKGICFMVLRRTSTCYAAVNRRLTELWSQYAADQQLVDVTVLARCRTLACSCMTKNEWLLETKETACTEWLTDVHCKKLISELCSYWLIGNFREAIISQRF